MSKPKPMMTAQRAEAAPENQAGSYSASFWFALFVSYIDKQFPGAGELVEKAAAILPWSKLSGAILHAYTDFKAGQSFIEILTHILSEWVEIEENDDDDSPIRMTAKPGV